MGNVLPFKRPEAPAPDDEDSVQAGAMEPYEYIRDYAQKLAQQDPPYEIYEYRSERAIQPDGAIAGLDWGEYVVGVAKCFGCKHTWVSIIAQESPDPMCFLECPKCHREKGVKKNPYGAPEGTVLWTCACGNDLFYISPKGHWCPNCGEYADYD